MKAIAFNRLAKWGDSGRCVCGHMPEVDELVLVRKENTDEQIIECAECRKAIKMHASRR